jgi:hypothetical protein
LVVAASIYGRDLLVGAMRRFRIAVGLLALGQLDLLSIDLLVRDHTEEMSDAIEPRAPLVIGVNDIPRGKRHVCGKKHIVSRAGVIIPTSMRLEVHGA